MFYTSVINIHTTPSNELVLFWLLRVSVVLMISLEVFTIYSYHYYKMASFIATGACTDPISFSVCLITCTSTILIISPMIMFISTTWIVSMIISIYILIIILMIISISTLLTISMIIFIFIILINNLMIVSISTILTISMITFISIISCQIQKGFCFGQIVVFLHSMCAVHVLLSDSFLTLLQLLSLVLFSFQYLVGLFVVLDFFSNRYVACSLDLGYK